MSFIIGFLAGGVLGIIYRVKIINGLTSGMESLKKLLSK